MEEGQEVLQPVPEAESNAGPPVEYSTSSIVPVWDIGEVIWAKLEGYPWWPAQVASFLIFVAVSCF